MEYAKRILSILVVVCMLLACFPVAAFATEVHPGEFLWENAHLDDSRESFWNAEWGHTENGEMKWSIVGAAEGYATLLSDNAEPAADTSGGITALTVGGVDALKTSAGNGWSFDAQTATLTLNGFNYTNHSIGYGIYAKGDLSIVVKGQNTIDVSLNAMDKDGNSAGIWVEGNLALQGDPDAYESLTVNAKNTKAAIYGFGLSIGDCEDIMAEASLICIYGDSYLNVLNSTITAATPDYSFYRSNEMAGFHSALGSMGGQATIQNSSVSVQAGLIGILGVPLVIENSQANIEADSWPVFADSGLLIADRSQVIATNTLTGELFADFVNWVGMPYLAAVYTNGGVDVSGSAVIANAPHVAILEEESDICVMDGGYIEASAGYSAIYSKANITIEESQIVARAGASIEDALAYSSNYGIAVPQNAMYVTDGKLSIVNSIVTAEGGFYGLGANATRIEGGSVEIKDSVYPLFGNTGVQLIDCQSVSISASEEKMAKFFELTGNFDIVGAIQSMTGRLEIIRCENVTAQGTMAGLFSHNSAIGIENSNVTASGGAYGIAGLGIVIESSHVQADAVWTPEERREWGNAPSYALFGVNELTFVEAAPTNGEIVQKNNDGYVLLDADWLYAASVTIEPVAHVHTEEIIYGKAATCTETGLTNGTRCSTCGEILVEQEVIPVTDHPTTLISGKDATCTEPGLTHGYQCYVCGVIVTEQEVIPALGHSYQGGFCFRCGELEPTEPTEPDPTDPTAPSEPDPDEPDDGEIIASGKAGTNLEWTLNSEGILKIFAVAEPDGSGDFSMNYTWGSYRNQITSIWMDNKVSSIAGEAFLNCNNLKDVTIGAGVKIIGDNAFLQCRSLKSLYIPDTVKSIGSFAFYGCENLESATIGAESIGNGAFQSCNKLEQVTIGAGVKTIGDEAFMYCRSLKSLYIPNTVESIGGLAFYGCENLEHATIGAELIGNNAFNECVNLKTLIIETQAISDSAFDNSTSLISVEIKKTVKTIGNSAFYGCENLENVTIEPGVESIGEQAFRFCSSLRSIEIPDTVKSIGDSAFDQCENLEEATIGAESVGNNAFYYCINLTSITLFDTVKSIGDSAFCGCEKLKDVTIGAEIIGANAFRSCSNLISVCILDTTRSIGDNAFYECGDLEDVTIGTGVKTIGSMVFGFCNSLKNLTIGAESIGAYAFSDYGNLTSVTILDSVKSIGERAFYECENLKNIAIGSGVETIGESAFAYCTNLKSITIPGNVKTIGEQAFVGCENLEKAVLEEGIQTIGIGMFYDCPKLTQVNIPEGLEYIPNGLISYNVTEIAIPESVKIIESYAFSGLKKLPMIIIPKNVTQIGGMAFVNTVSLTTVVFEGNAPEMNSPFYCASFNGVMFYPKNDPTWADIDNILLNSGGLMAAIPYTRDSQGNIIPETPDEATVKNNISWFRNQVYPAGTNYPDNFSYIINGNMLTGYGKEAFAFELSDACFGYLPISENRSVSYESLKLGDILYTDSGVWVITELNASGLKAAGVDANNQVRYDLQMTRAEVSAADACRTRYGVSPYPGEIDPAQNLPKIEGPDHILTEAEVYEVIMAQQANFPEGMPYSSKNHYFRNVTFYVGEAVTYGQDGHGCSAFAGLISDLAFGDLPAIYIPAGSVVYDNIMVGDLLHIPGHEMVVIEVHPDYVVIAEAGYDDGTGERVHWGRQITREEIEADYAVVTRYPDNMDVEHVHSWTDATCTTPKTCPCGATNGDAYGHNEQTVHGKKATCTETGLTDGRACSRCDEVLVAQEVIPATGHTEEIIPGKAATCTETGLTEGRGCSDCDEIIVSQEVIPATGHTEVIIRGEAATCTETGLTDGYECSVCGETTVVQEVIEALGHSYDSGRITREPTCTESGVKTLTCVRCSDSVEEEEEALGHSYDDGTITSAPSCTESGVKTFKCVRCSDFYTEEVEALGHCYKFGYCTICGEEDPSEPEEIASGDCGTNVAWSLDSRGTLEIYGVTEPVTYNLRVTAPTLASAGNFRMDDYASSKEAPWAAYADQIARIQVDKLVTRIGSNAFSSCENLKDVAIGDGVESIGERAFADCAKLEKVVIGESVTEVLDEAFAGCEEVVVTFIGDEPAVADSTFENTTATVNYPVGNETWEDEFQNNYGENVTVQAHTHRYSEEITEATCLTDGYTTYTCDCGHKYQDDYVTAPGHKDEDHNHTCDVCQEVVSECVDEDEDRYCDICDIALGIFGDVNDDGEVDVFDANLVVSYFYGSVDLTDAQIACADVNGDGEVDVFDANLIVSYFYGSIDYFPVEEN